MLDQIKNSLKNSLQTLIQRFSVSNSYPIKPGEYPRAGASFLGVSASEKGPDGKPAKASADIEVLFPYGLMAALPITASAGIKFNVSGDPANRIGIAYDPNTLPALKVGEVAVGAFSAIVPTYLKFTDQGTIEVWRAGILVIADLITHLHSGVTTGPGVSGPPVL
jgi:hypothetical protein